MRKSLGNPLHKYCTLIETKNCFFEYTIDISNIVIYNFYILHYHLPIRVCIRTIASSEKIYHNTIVFKSYKNGIPLPIYLPAQFLQENYISDHINLRLYYPNMPDIAPRVFLKARLYNQWIKNQECTSLQWDDTVIPIFSKDLHN